MIRWIALAALLAAPPMVPSGDPAPASPPTAPLKAAPGLTLAQRHCGGCHAVGSGRSPLSDAPAFAELHRRYPAGCLEATLNEGMLAPSRPAEEGGPRRHPRMPMTELGDDQRAELITYLRGLDPRPDPPSPACLERSPVP